MPLRRQSRRLSLKHLARKQQATANAKPPRLRVRVSMYGCASRRFFCTCSVCFVIGAHWDWVGWVDRRQDPGYQDT
eukprot:5333801-Pyramimonas_sp.AAC.1